MNFKKIKITHQIINLCFYGFLIIFILITLSCLYLFLYNNLYQTITQSKKILILEKKIAVKMININTFNVVIEKLNQKIIPIKIITNLNNPFD
ncbi:MAG: hypothetical protein ABH818_01975 [Patescibacteria group bacterium]|nr:hypothetical protein [Patescibacteria group bacterium]MBU1871082.1 hypothetical protein [Patescibacteria group bacterium]